MFPSFNKIPKLNKSIVDETLNIYNILNNRDEQEYLFNIYMYVHMYVCMYKTLSLRRNVYITIFDDVVLCVFLFNFLILSGITLQNV